MINMIWRASVPTSRLPVKIFATLPFKNLVGEYYYVKPE